MSETVNPDLDPGYTTKLFVLRMARRDFAMLEDMLAKAQEKIPTMDRVDHVVSAIIAEVCRLRREQPAGGTPALPGGKAA